MAPVDDLLFLIDLRKDTFIRVLEYRNFIF